MAARKLAAVLLRQVRVLTRYLQVNVSAEFGTRKGAQFGYSLEIAAFTAADASTWVADAKKLVKWPCLKNKGKVPQMNTSLYRGGRFEGHIIDDVVSLKCDDAHGLPLLPKSIALPGLLRSSSAFTGTAASLFARSHGVTRSEGLQL